MSSPGKKVSAGSGFRCPVTLQTARVGALVVLWYTLGTLLSFFNKILVGKDSKVFQEPFPAPLFMSGVQFAMQHLLARAMFQTGLIQRTADVLTWPEYGKNIVPNGACTGLDIGFSMMSLVFISLSFYTMCKATVPLFLLAFAFTWGIEKPTWRLGLVVLIITLGLILLVSGEAQFDAAGFSLVMVAACCSGLRFTLTQVYLHGHQEGAAFGGPLEILEALTPVMSATVLLLSLVWERLWAVLPRSSFFVTPTHTLLTLGLIFLGAVIAFLLVWTEYKLIKETSALTFMIAGTCKEIVTVMAAVVFMGDAFGWVNAVGLAIVVCGVVLFNLYKLQKVKKGKATLKGSPSSRGSHDSAAVEPSARAYGDVTGIAMEMQPLMLMSGAAAGAGDGLQEDWGSGGGGLPSSAGPSGAGSSPRIPAPKPANGVPVTGKPLPSAGGSGQQADVLLQDKAGPGAPVHPPGSVSLIVATPTRGASKDPDLT